VRVRLTTLCENTAGVFGFTGEWGLSILVQFEGETVLLDTGLSSSIVHNATAANVNIKNIKKVVLSHGHVDHTGGLRVLLKAIRSKVEVFAHPEIWAKKYSVRPKISGDRYHFIGIPFCYEELEHLGASFTHSKTPVWLNDDMVTTGEVPMITSFEKIDKNLYVKTGKGFEPDPLPDDQALVVKSPNGLVVVLGCAHRGIINTLIHAREITGTKKILAVVGGAHLFRAGKEQLTQTILELKKMGVEHIGVSHCTGMPASMALANAFEANFFFNNAGTVVEL
jgi:7,8-dihydropterin-6-yl-methyl-4-(beta-D-ribofuranosyl)aminobenzene 5'-phosphate synthase